MPVPSWLTAKLVAIVVGSLLLVGLVLGLRHYRSLANERGDKLEAICKATGVAASEPKLKCADVIVQISQLGTSLANTTAALDRQNAAVQALGDETKRQQADYTRGSQIAQERAGQARATSGGLMASSRSSERVAQPCVPSKALQEAWK